MRTKGREKPLGDLDGCSLGGFKGRGMKDRSVVPIVLGATVSPLPVMLA